MTFYGIYDIINLKINKKVKILPLNDFEKFKKLVNKNEVFDFDVGKTISQAIEHTERINKRNVQLTLLAADFFREDHGDIFSSKIHPINVIPPHNHDYYEINYVISGKCVQYIANHIYILNEGDFIMMPPSVVHTPAAVGNSQCINILIRTEWIRNFEKRMLSHDHGNFLTQMQKQDKFIIFNAKDKPAFETAKQMTKYFMDKQQYIHFHELFTSALAQKLLVELAECPYTETFYTAPHLALTTDVIAQILQYISDNISTVTLESAAAHFGYYPSHLSRIIKKHTGNGFATYITLQRMLHAEEYLVKTEIPIGKIPSLVGLDSSEYFSRVFKKYNNVTPSEYRKIKKNENK